MRAYYERGEEWERLDTPSGRLEFVRTQEMYVPELLGRGPHLLLTARKTGE